MVLKWAKNGGWKKLLSMSILKPCETSYIWSCIMKKVVSWHINNLIHFLNVIFYVNSDKIVQTCKIAEIKSNF